MGSPQLPIPNPKAQEISAGEDQSIKLLQLTANLNLAQCYIKLGELQKALKFCNGALAMDPKNTKGLYRRGLVYNSMGNWGSAEEDLLKALEVVPDDVAVKRCLKIAQKGVRKQEQGLAKKMQKAFG